MEFASKIGNSPRWYHFRNANARPVFSGQTPDPDRIAADDSTTSGTHLPVALCSVCATNGGVFSPELLFPPRVKTSTADFSLFDATI